MTPQLSHTLHDLVDGDGDAPFEVRALTTRIRRRRAVRTGTRGAVAAGAVGVVALGLTRGPWEGGVQLPAADPHAAPGTCGSDIAALPTGGADGAVRAESEEDIGTMFDPLLGRRLAADVLVAGSESALAGTGTADLLGERNVLRRTHDDGTDIDGKPLDAAALAAAETRIAQLQSEIDAAAGKLEPLRLRLVVTRDGTVVSTPASTGDVYSWEAPDVGGTYVMLTGELVTCDRAADPLPAGRYEAYATFLDPATGAETATGSWPVDLLPAPTRMVGLPAGFPADVPLLSGGLVTAHKTADGWVAEIAVDAADNVNAAAHLIVDGGGGTASRPIDAGFLPAPSAEVETSDWHVLITRATSPDGGFSVIYDLTPR
jgi:hypothetical protein